MGGTRTGCVYKGTPYAVHSTWDDGCDFTCQCIDDVTGMYQCTQKCPTYTMLPPSLVLVAVEGPVLQAAEEHRGPADHYSRHALLRQVRQLPVLHQERLLRNLQGWAEAHCPMFCGICNATTPAPPCIDVLPNCQNYGSQSCLPPYVDWAYDNCRNFCNYCNGYPEFSTTPVSTTLWTTPASGCFDKLPNCHEYGDYVCTDHSYKQWVLDNCQKYCHVGECDNTTTTPSGPCQDKINNCESYGPSSCVGIYAGWAGNNCPRYCNLCTSTSSEAQVTTTTVATSCRDKLSNCDNYGKSVCQAPEYHAWASDNCAAYCGVCSETLTTGKIVMPSGWVVLMKGVSGVPGDLWQLWSGTGTANENIPQAQSLTNQYPGHYKPPIANEWSACKFERVKVAVYSEGVEKGNIVFNVLNSGKNDWFRPENVISSTWNDLPSTASSFSMPGDVTSGREFAVATSTVARATDGSWSQP
ncbi:uncharacterized protein LOC112577008 [Pomacea canaliculata]|uniref:uncharacterized protein LOC112577008 n=1 Tax=Pomacea canaliculata TaxID=400727 RepID=UPI000D7261EA|nr:uncharacterized protein LOC112577008 [Pomacea canaliculata]